MIIGHLSETETSEFTIHHIVLKKVSGFYIDTPEFNDSNEDKNDNETVLSIFRKRNLEHNYDLVVCDAQ